MIDKILNAKHWQIFLIGFGLPMIFYFVWIFSFINRIMAMEGIPNAEEVMPQMIFGDMKYMFIFAIIMSALLMIWQWSVAVGLQTKIAPNLKLNLRTFKIFLFIPLIFTIGYMYWMQSFFDQMILMSKGIEDIEQFQQSIFSMTFILPLSLLSMFCSFYIMYICAKTIKTAETQGKVKLGDIVGEIVLIWFLPIGIWFLQPRINVLMKKEDESELIGSLID